MLAAVTSETWLPVAIIMMLFETEDNPTPLA
jgi:hypothetical protein